MLIEFIKVFGYRLILAAATFLADVVLSRHLGPELKGYYYLLIITPILFAVVVSLGQDYAINYWGHIEPESIFRFYMSSLMLVLFTGVIAFCLLYLDVAGSLSFILSGVDKNFSMAKRLSMLSLIIEPLFIITGMLLITRKQPVEYGKMRIVRRGGFLLAILIVFQVIRSRDESLFMALIIVQFGAVIVSVVYGLVKTNFRFQLPGYKINALLSEGANSYLGRLSERFLLRAGSIILGALASGKAVGYLSVALGISEVLFFLSGSLAYVLFSKNARENWKNHAQACRLILPTACVLALATGLVSQAAIPFLYGKEFSISTHLVWILLPGTVFMSMVYTMSPFLLQRKLSRLISASYFTGLLSNGLLCLTIIPSLGAKGAAASITISYGITWAFMLTGLCIHEKIPVSTFLVCTKTDLWQTFRALRKLHTNT